jgi:glycosyltransferase involved in cell wall biosynthesis
MQKTDFPIEILIHDDCSTDGTTEIIREYEAKYPDLIFPLYEEENQYQQGKAAEIDFYNYRRARGKYIAYCEGDDYWTDPLKLQKQVDFMEANQEYSVCFHDFQIHDERTDKWIKPSYNMGRVLQEGGEDITTAMFLRNANYGQPLTMLFRKSNFDYLWSRQYKYYRDTHEIYHLLRTGKGRIIGFVGGVYNLHSQGVNTSLGIPNSAIITSEILKEIYLNNPTDIVIKDFIFSSLVWNYEVLPSMKFYSELVKYSSVSISLVIHVLYCIFKRNIKKKINNLLKE